MSKKIQLSGKKRKSVSSAPVDAPVPDDILVTMAETAQDELATLEDVANVQALIAEIQKTIDLSNPTLINQSTAISKLTEQVNNLAIDLKSTQQQLIDTTTATNTTLNALNAALASLDSTFQAHSTMTDLSLAQSADVSMGTAAEMMAAFKVEVNAEIASLRSNLETIAYRAATAIHTANESLRLSKGDGRIPDTMYPDDHGAIAYTAEYAPDKALRLAGKSYDVSTFDSGAYNPGRLVNPAIAPAGRPLNSTPPQVPGFPQPGEIPIV